MATELIESKSNFAKRLNHSKGYISQLAKSGLPCTTQGAVRVDAALKWIRENVKPSAGRPAGAAEGGDDADALTVAKIRLLCVQTERATLELAVRRGEFLDKEEARRAVRALMRTFRAAMLNFANRYAADIAADTGCDMVQLAASLELRMNAALTELARTPAPADAGAFGETV